MTRKNNVKILILSFYYTPDLSAGSFRTESLVNSITTRHKNVNITVVTTMPNRYNSFKVTADIHDLGKNIHIRRVVLPRHNNGIFDQIFSFLSYAKFILFKVKNENYNMVFATSSRLMTAFLGAIMSRKFKVPLYLDIRDLFSDSISDIYKNRTPRLVLSIIKLIEKWTFKQASVINLVSEGFLEDAKKISSQTKYRIYTNGIDDIFLKKDYNNIIKASFPITILYAGNIGEGQGLDAIIPGLALGLEGKAVFKIIGSGGARIKLEKQLLEQNVKNVELIDPISRDELLSYYREANVLFIHLNDFDAFKKVLPSKFFEYAATEKYILAGASGYANAFFNESIDGVRTFKPCDIQGALNAFNEFNFEEISINRNDFCKKYLRSSIMNKMADDIILLLKNKIR